MIQQRPSIVRFLDCILGLKTFISEKENNLAIFNGLQIFHQRKQKRKNLTIFRCLEKNTINPWTSRLCIGLKTFLCALRAGKCEDQICHFPTKLVSYGWILFHFMGEENVMIKQHRERNIKEKKIFQLFLVLERSEKSLRIFCLFCKEFEKWANREFSYIVIAVVHGLQSFLSLNNIFPLFFNFFSFIQT